MASAVSDPDVPLGAQLLSGPVGFRSGAVWEGVKIQTLPSEWTRPSTLIEVLTGLLTKETTGKRFHAVFGKALASLLSGTKDRSPNS